MAPMRIDRNASYTQEKTINCNAIRHLDMQHQYNRYIITNDNNINNNNNNGSHVYLPLPDDASVWA